VLKVGGELVGGLKLLGEPGEQVLVGIRHFTTLPAHQVDVRPVLVGGVNHPSFSQVDAAGETLFHQQVERAIDGGYIYSVRPILDFGIYFFGVDVLARMGDRFDDHLALWCDAVSAGAQSIDECLTR